MTQRMRAPKPSSPEALRRMRTTGRRDTQPELALRKELHGLGLRYRVDRPPIKGSRRRADVVFAKAQVAVYVDGCFWHGCPEHGTWPKANADWWRAKIQRNQERDEDTDQGLRENGWVSVRVWEHEDPKVAASRIAALVRERLQGR